jgi:2C-methyl-D-erythritol 2,4-cyclodiphosphate synthase
VLLTHAWKSGDVSDGDVTAHAMAHAIATTKRMVIVIFHHDPVAWHGADL